MELRISRILKPLLAATLVSALPCQVYTAETAPSPIAVIGSPGAEWHPIEVQQNSLASIAEGVFPPSAPDRPQASGSGDPGPSLTLDDLQNMALQSNPSLIQAAMGVRAAQGGYVQAGLYPNPTMAYIADEVGNEGAAGFQGGGVTQEIVTSGKLRLERAVASHEIQEARDAWEAQRWRVMNDVRAGYYETLLAQKTIEVKRQLVGIDQQLLNATEQLRRAQEVSEVDVLQARVETEDAQLSLSEAQDVYVATWRRLTAVLGRPEMEPVSLVGDVTRNLPVLTWEDVLSRLLTESPEIAQARSGVERARCELAKQCAERIPNFEMGAVVKQDTANGYTVVDVGVAVPLMIFNRNQGNILRAQAELTSAQNDLKRIELQLRGRLATTFQQYLNAHRRSERYAGTIIPNARKSLDMTTTGYRQGELPYLTLLMAQRTYYDTTLRYLSSLEELWDRSVNLEGMLLRGGLSAPARN